MYFFIQTTKTKPKPDLTFNKPAKQGFRNENVILSLNQQVCQGAVHCKPEHDHTPPHISFLDVSTMMTMLTRDVFLGIRSNTRSLR